jgi:PII-like signaling protein
MNKVEVTAVRIYLSEKDGRLENLLRRLRDWEKVRGVTVFRGISGFGESMEGHLPRLAGLTQNLSAVVEFFDAPDKIARIIEHLRASIKPGHIVQWTARADEPANEID